MKLFALGRTDLANSCKLGLAGKAEKFTEKVVILLRILSSVGEAWRPPGHPRRLRPVQVVSLLDTVVCSYSKQSSLRVMGFVSLGRYGRHQRVENWCCSLFIVFLFQIFDLCYRSTVFVHSSFSNNCLVFVLVCNHPTTHPQVSTPDVFSEDFSKRLKVRYNMKKGLLIFTKYSQLRAELLSIVRWGLISPQRPQFEG